jgi:hypothetical protein
MSDKLAGGIKAGSTSVQLPIVLRKSADSTEQTAKVAADMTLSYWRQGGLRVAITASDLAAVNSAYSSGGVKEVDATNMPGMYRVDIPDAALATGADWVVLAVKIANDFVFYERFNLETKGAAENSTDLATLLARLTSGRATNLDNLDAAITTRTKPADTQAAVTTVTNLTNAPTAGDFTAVMKTSLNASTPASVQGAVASVTGAVGSIAAGGIGSTTLTQGAKDGIADGVLDRTDGVESGETVRQMLRLSRSVLYGIATGLRTATARFRDRANTKDRLVVTRDTTTGDRTVVVTDPS